MSTFSSGAPPATPVILGQRYRLDRKLAQGGMAEVWVATDLSLSRQVALKLLKPSLAADPVVAERFRREAVAVAQLAHPNIVTVYDAVEDRSHGEHRHAVVMQLVNGMSLRQLLDEKKRLSPDLTIHIGACVAAALDCAHRAKLVHRDVKPGNILVTPDGLVLLTDFGIAKVMPGHGDDDLTNPNVMMGTAKYLSPEQVKGAPLDGRADLYSLGLVLYECLAGRVPFLGETETDTALARLHRDPTDLTRLRPTLPQGLADLIHRLLARDPERRYPSGAAVREELLRIDATPQPAVARVAPGFWAQDVTEQSSPPARQGAPAGASHPAARHAARPVQGRPAGRPVRTPAPVGGYRPVPAGTGRAVGAPVRPTDRTPPAIERPRQQPNRKNEHNTRPAKVIIGGLLLTALAVGGLLWATLRTGDSSEAPPLSTVDPGTLLPGSGSATSTLTTPTSSPVPTTELANSPTSAPGSPTNPAVAPSVHTFDPDGDGEERDDLVPLATDGDPSTAWYTVCYDNQYLGGKHGAGLVLDLGTSRTGLFSVSIANGPYQVSLYAAADGAEPTSFGAWGDSVDHFYDTEPGTLTFKFDDPVRYVLVSFNELGPDGQCSGDRYRGGIQEMGFA